MMLKLVMIRSIWMIWMIVMTGRMSYKVTLPDPSEAATESSPPSMPGQPEERTLALADPRFKRVTTLQKHGKAVSSIIVRKLRSQHHRYHLNKHSHHCTHGIIINNNSNLNIDIIIISIITTP